MIPAETSPAKLFAHLFLEGKPNEVREQQQRLNDGKSILDELGSQANKLKGKASSSDNHLLNDYFDSVRQAETNIAAAQDWMDKPKPKVDAKQPSDINDRADMIGRARLLMDLVPLIVQTDSSRVITIMIQDHYVVPKVAGVSGNHHNLSHHGQDRSASTNRARDCQLLWGLAGQNEIQIRIRFIFAGQHIDSIRKQPWQRQRTSRAESSGLPCRRWFQSRSIRQAKEGHAALQSVCLDA